MEISLREKVSINKFTFVDLIVSLCAQPMGVTLQKRKDRNPFTQKNNDYLRLLRGLERGYDEKLIEPYMFSICGRSQVKNAIRRGFVTKEQWDVLRNKYPLYRLAKEKQKESVTPKEGELSISSEYIYFHNP